MVESLAKDSRQQEFAAVSKTEIGKKMKIAVIGMPGAGKSTLASSSEYQGYEIWDMDHIIEWEQGMSIAAFFSSYGEAAFRRLECQLLERALSSNAERLLLLCGGGVVETADARKLLRKFDSVKYLRVDFDTLVSRLSRPEERSKRPLLCAGADDEWKTRLWELYQRRIPWYEEVEK